MSEHTQKEIDREAEQVFPYPNRDFCLDRKDYEQSCALVDLKRIVWIAGRSKSISRERELEEALRLCEEYFDSRADADHNGEGFVPNEEMKLLSMIRKLLKS